MTKESVKIRRSLHLNQVNHHWRHLNWNLRRNQQCQSPQPKQVKHKQDQCLFCLLSLSLSLIFVQLSHFISLILICHLTHINVVRVNVFQTDIRTPSLFIHKKENKQKLFSFVSCFSLDKSSLVIFSI